MRIIVVGNNIFVSKIKEIEFIRIKSASKFKFKCTDIVIIFNDYENINNGTVCYFSENEPTRREFKYSLKSIDSNEINKLKIREFLTILY